MEEYIEKRQISRVGDSLKGQAEYDGRIFPGKILNISLNGLQFCSDKPIDAGPHEKVTVSLHLDGDENKDASSIGCVVVRNDGHLLGLQFDVVDFDTLMSLRERLTDRIGGKVNAEFIDFMFGAK